MKSTYIVQYTGFRAGEAITVESEISNLSTANQIFESECDKNSNRRGYISTTSRAFVEAMRDLKNISPRDLWYLKIYKTDGISWESVRTSNESWWIDPKKH